MLNKWKLLFKNILKKTEKTFEANIELLKTKQIFLRTFKWNIGHRDSLK